MHEIIVGEPQVYRGIFVAHWEIARFIFDAGQRRFWLFPAWERWMLHFPPGYRLPWSKEYGGEPQGRVAGRCFDMELKGVVSEKGRFGHKGILRRQVLVERVLYAEEIGPARVPW